jgi:hypothetical protein
MAPSQKKKNVASMHASAATLGYSPVLEVSTKSDEKLGQRLSAFNLKVHLADGRTVPLECAFQGGKVFERGGPYVDLYEKEGRDARRDERLVTSGPITGFRFEGKSFPLIPKTAFYDWLYIRALYPHRDFLQRLRQFAGFSDIEFNPERSINCQARSCATFVSLDRLELLAECVESADRFIQVLLPDSLEQPHSDVERQKNLFG